MTRKTTRILGLGEFRYTEELLAAAMTRTRADLYREVSERKVYGRSTMDKRALAIVLVDGYLQEQDALNARITETLDAIAPLPAAHVIEAVCDHGHTREEGCPEAPCWVPADLSDAIDAAVDRALYIGDLKEELADAVAKGQHQRSGEIATQLERLGYVAPEEKCLLEHGYVKPCQQDRGHAGDCDKETVGLVRKTGDASAPSAPRVDDLGRHVHVTASGHTISLPAELCDHGIDASRVGLCGICREDAAKAPKVGQRYRRADGDVVELKAVFPLDQSIAFLIVEAPNHTYRRGLRGTVSFSGLAEHYELAPSAAPNALMWAGTRYLVLGTVDYQGGRAVRLIEDDDQPSSFGRIDFSFCIRETELRHGSWSAYAQNTTLICAKSFNSDGDRGICGVRQIPGPRGLHEGPHYDEHRGLWSDYTMPGDRRPRCGVDMPALPGMAEFTGPTRTCNLLLNADGVCPDVNHRQGDQRARCGIEVVPLLSGHAPYPCGLLLNADGACSDANHRPAIASEKWAAAVEPHSIDAELIRQRVAAEEKLYGLRCALAEQIGRWSVGSAKEAQLSRVLESILKEHR